MSVEITVEMTNKIQHILNDVSLTWGVNKQGSQFVRPEDSYRYVIMKNWVTWLKYYAARTVPSGATAITDAIQVPEFGHPVTEAYINQIINAGVGVVNWCNRIEGAPSCNGSECNISECNTVECNDSECHLSECNRDECHKSECNRSECRVNECDRAGEGRSSAGWH